MAPHRRILAALVALTALGATTAALAAVTDNARSARAASAHATAYGRDDSNGRTAYVRASGNQSRSRGGSSASTSTANGHGSATARARVTSVDIFGGLVTARSATARASASGGGETLVGRVGGLKIDGKSKGTWTTTHTFSLKGYGHLTVLDSAGSGIVAMRATLTRSYQSYSAGSTVKVAYAAASASDAVAPPKPKPKPHPKPKPRPSKPKPPAAKPKPKPHAGPSKPTKPPKAKRRKAPRTRTLATNKGFVFPVYGPHNFTDTYGAFRADTGFHEGVDIFAAAGTPVVAVCKGTLNRVGTLTIAGNRLWVKCDKGHDAFFYAHLSAFANDTRAGEHVTPGKVLGFVGSTGDAEQTPPHLHFEVHPHNGPSVDPYPFLRAWESRRDVPAAAWVRQNGATGVEEPGTLVVVHDFLDR